MSGPAATALTAVTGIFCPRFTCYHFQLSRRGRYARAEALELSHIQCASYRALLRNTAAGFYWWKVLSTTKTISTCCRISPVLVALTVELDTHCAPCGVRAPHPLQHLYLISVEGFFVNGTSDVHRSIRLNHTLSFAGSHWMLTALIGFSVTADG